MADEDEVLEGLDDFGTDEDFSDQLDNFMDGEADDGGGGGDDGDSELDSFFEDLSTIDDLEVKEPEESFEEEEEAEEEESFDEPLEDLAPPPMEEEPEEKKSLLKPLLISMFLGLLSGGIAVGVLYWMNQPEPEPEPEPEPPPVVAPAPVPLPPPPPQVVYVEKAPPPPPPVVAPPPPAPPKPVKLTRYYVQVANCIHQECVDDYRFLLKRYGYPVKVIKNTDRTPMTEILSRQTLKEEEASRWVNRINQDNQLTGQAYRRREGDHYRISMGLFFDLDTANRVKAHLNQLYHAQLRFEAKRSEQKIQYHKIRIGGFGDKATANQMKQLLQKQDSRLQGAFVISKVE